MEYRQLRYFVAVAEELHFAKAAERLHITQPALSKQIQALEKHLDIQLFKRTKQQVQLTVAGKVFLPQVQQLLVQAQQAVELAKRAARGEVGRLTIGFTPSARSYVLPEILRVFRSNYPDVELVMRGICTEEQVEALQNHEIDIAFLHPPITKKRLNIHPLLEEDFLLVLPQGHPLETYEQVPLEALVRECFIIHPPEKGIVLYEEFFTICEKFGFKPRVIESPSYEARIALVASGVGVTFIPANVESFVGSGVVCRKMKGVTPKLQLAAAWRQEELCPVLVEFIKVIINLQVLPST